MITAYCGETSYIHNLHANIHVSNYIMYKRTSESTTDLFQALVPVAAALCYYY